MNIKNAVIKKIYRAFCKNPAKAAVFLTAVCMITASVPSAAAADVLNPFQPQDVQATTIRLAKSEGNVMVTNSAGKAVFKQENMRLTNGTHIETG
jgi:hypothetical protein